MNFLVGRCDETATAAARWWRLAVGLGLLAVAGCTTAGARPDDPSLSWLWEPPPVGEYVLEVGDVLDVKLFYHPELNDVGTVIRPDGQISLPLVGDVEGRGQTTASLSARLAERYTAAGLRSPSVAIILRKSAGLRVFVGGEVNQPGMVAHEGTLTLSRAILQAGGLKSTGEPASVVVLRKPGVPGAKPLFGVLDFRAVLAGDADPVLSPYDVVFVPKSTVATLNQMVDQYFVKMVPITLTAGFSYSLGTINSNTKGQQ